MRKNDLKHAKTPLVAFLLLSSLLPFTAPAASAYVGTLTLSCPVGGEGLWADWTWSGPADEYHLYVSDNGDYTTLNPFEHTASEAHVTAPWTTHAWSVAVYAVHGGTESLVDEKWGTPCDLVAPRMSSQAPSPQWTDAPVLEGVEVRSYARITQMWWANSQSPGGLTDDRGWMPLSFPSEPKVHPYVDYPWIEPAHAWTGLDIMPGPSYVSIRAMDEAGNTATLADAARFQHNPYPPRVDVTSPSHARPTTVYGSDDPSFEWDVWSMDGLSDLRHAVGQHDCGTVLSGAAPRPTSQTTTTYQNVGSFGEFRFCIRAENTLGKATTESVVFRIDTIPPEVSDHYPADEAVLDDAFAPITAGFWDPDGRLDVDPPVWTDVQPDATRLVVDGVDHTELWSRFCGQTVRAAGAASLQTRDSSFCPIQANATHFHYDPPIAWSEGWHEVRLSIRDTASPGNWMTEVWSFLVASTGEATPPEVPGDGDQDGIPDDFEERLCRAEHPNLGSDGSCDGTQWHPPSEGAPLGDVGWLLG